MKVSIIVPVYNMEKRINKCLDSLVNQTYKNIEIIIINDGSMDHSLDIIREYQSKDSRIKVINQRNMGISEARNNGLAIATGDFICFADSDDYLELNMIEELVNKITTDKSDIVICDYYMFDEKSRKVMTVGYDSLFGGSIYDNPNIIKDIDFAPWNKIYKKELFDSIKFPVNTKYEDFETILKVFSKASKITKLNRPLYDYYFNMFGETRNQTTKNMDMLKIAINLEEYFDFNGKSVILRDAYVSTISEKLLHSASTLFKITSLKECLKYINAVYKYLGKYPKWKKLYRKNKIDSKYIKFIRGHKFMLKLYATLRITLYKIIGR